MKIKVNGKQEYFLALQQSQTQSVSYAIHGDQLLLLQIIEVLLSVGVFVELPGSCHENAMVFTWNNHTFSERLSWTKERFDFVSPRIHCETNNRVRCLLFKKISRHNISTLERVYDVSTVAFMSRLASHDVKVIHPDRGSQSLRSLTTRSKAPWVRADNVGQHVRVGLGFISRSSIH